MTVEQGVSAGGRHLRRLWAAVALGVLTVAVQLGVGLATSSLALLADSAHVFTDIFGVALAALAITVARNAAVGPGRTFGLYRSEVLAALVNAVLLFGVAGWVVYEAVARFDAPPEVPGWPVTVVAVVGLGMNVGSFLLLKEGVLVSGLVTVVFGWRYADPVIGVGIGLFVLPRAWRLGRSALRILFQHAPEGVDVGEMTDDLAGLPGVCEVHDLHVWTLTSGMEVVSAHLTISDGADQQAVLVAAQDLLAEDYHIGHCTLQIEATNVQCTDVTW
jgi:cobalt-zinc-cadmium efflux system protein